MNKLVWFPDRAMRCGLPVLLLIVVLGGCQHEERRTFEGLTEGDYVRLALPAAGSLSKLEVKPGTVVSQGAPVFSLAEADELAGYRDASRRLAEMQRAGNNAERSDVRVLDSLKAEVAQAQWMVSSKSASAPVGGMVTETLFSAGDWVPAGAPVVAILPANAITVHFLVPIDVANQLQQGRDVTITCARCEQPVKAKVTYVSPFAQPGADAGNLGTLRYAVEARPGSGQAQWLRPGDAVSINL